MKKYKLSIIIPYYNAKKYCDELLSVIDKQIQESVQVILIDDGSSEKYEPNYHWIEVYRKENGGASSARNFGLEKSKGEYISFIDSDDLISNNYISLILNKIEKEKFDYCYLSWKSFGSWKVEIKLTSIEEEFPDYNLCCWNRVYKKNVIGNTRFNEKKIIAEDAEFIRDVQVNCKKKSFIPEILYLYRSDTPNSLTKQYNEGKINMPRYIYNFSKVNKSMTYLLEEIKEKNKNGEVIIMTNDNEIPELKRYAMITKPIPIKGTELIGEDTNLFTKITLPLKTQIVIWAGNIFEIGGMESFLFYFCSIMSKYYQITIMYKYLDSEQRKRLQPYVNFISSSTKITCDVLISNRMLDPAPDTISYKKKVQMIHCCKISEMWIVPKNNDLLILVSKTVENSYISDIGNHPTKIIPNLVNINNNSKKALRLITASRLTYEKGGNRILKFAEILHKNNIPFIWTIFSNERLTKDIEGIVYMKPTLNIIPFIKSSDYLVQLSDSEAFCYSIVESLSVGVPVITTSLPVLSDIGFINEYHGFEVPLDMQNIDIDKIYSSSLSFEYKLDNEKIVKQWKEVIGELEIINNTYINDTDDYVKIRISIMYKDTQIGRVISPGEILIIKRTRAEEIQKAGFGKILKT